MVQHEKGKHGTHEDEAKQQADTSTKPSPHQGPAGPVPGTSEALGGVGSPTSGPEGEPLVKPPENPPGQPEEGSASAAGKVGETDLPSSSPPEPPESPKK